MSRLLTTLLLYQEGYDICRYVSLESKIRSNLKGYYDALESSEEGWFDNTSSYEPFIDYFLGVLFLSIASMTGDWLMRSRTRANPVP